MNNQICGHCGKDLMDPLTTNVSVDSFMDQPVYWADPYFWPNITERVFFCNAEHSLQWTKTTTATGILPTTGRHKL